MYRPKCWHCSKEYKEFIRSGDDTFDVGICECKEARQERDFLEGTANAFADLMYA